MSKEEDWLEGGALEDDVRAAVSESRGENVTKERFAKITGLARGTVDKFIKEGMPVVSRGNRTQAWKLNTADGIEWLRKRDVQLATGDEETLSFDAAKRRDKEAQARLREIQIAQREGLLIEVERVVDFIGKKFGVVRSRFLAVESQVTGLTEDQRDELKAAVNDAFSDMSGHTLADWVEDADDDSEFEGSEEPPKT